jgi:hypothetical protein
MRKALLILAALFMVAGGIAYAAIPGADGTINGCYKERRNAPRDRRGSRSDV